jgi:hypothetical protein
MTQADSVHSTPRTNTSKIDPPVDPTRRHLLTLAAGGGVAAVGISTTAQAAGSPADPILRDSDCELIAQLDSRFMPAIGRAN